MIGLDSQVGTLIGQSGDEELWVCADFKKLCALDAVNLNSFGELYG